MKNRSIDVTGMTAKKFDHATRKKFPKIIAQSTSTAINKTLTKIRTRNTKAISKASKIRPQKLIRGRHGMVRASARVPNGIIYFRYAPMPVEITAGKAGPRWNRKMTGAKVKGKIYDGAFVATPRSGKHSGKRARVYNRVSNTGVAKDDLRPVTHKLEKYSGVLITVAKRVVQQELEQIFLNQYKWRLDKLTTKLNAK